MSDFLTRLVTATYGAAPVMRPRPVAHYEPLTTPPPLWPQDVEAALPVAPAEVTGSTALANPAGAPGAAQTPPSVSGDSVNRVAPAASARTQVRPLAAPLHERRHDAPVVRREADPPVPTASPARTPQRALAAEEERAALAGNKSASPASSPLAANRRPALPPVAPAPPGTRRGNLQSDPQPPLAPTAPLPTTLTPASASSPQTEMRASVPTAQRASSATPSPPASLAVQRAALLAGAPGETDDAPSAQGAARRPAQSPGRSLPDPALRSPVAQSEERTASTPVVRVTIGRIIIKAEPASPARPAPTPRAALPSLSLDQYLKGREGGGV